MTRWSGVVGVEGVATGDGRYVEPGSITFPRGPVALIEFTKHKLVGYADAFERDGQFIRASGELHEEVDGDTTTLVLTSLKVDKGTGHTTAGEIRAVYIGEYESAWPECKRDR